MAFIPAEFYTESPNGFDFDLSEKVFNHYFAPNIKNIKDYSSDTRPHVCNYKGEGCHQNPAYKCSILNNDILLCFVIHYPTGRMSFQIGISPAKTKLIAGKDVFGLGVQRDITQNNFNMNFTKSAKAEYPKETIINACTNSQVFTGGTDREYWCTYLIQNNGWKIPPDYPIKF